MNTRMIAQEYRLAHWADKMRERVERGLSVSAYCKEIGIHENSYYYWQRKLREAACGEMMKLENTAGMIPQGFTEVKLQAQSIMSLSTASVQNHVCIEAGWMRVSASCDYPVEKLKEILRMAVRP